MDKSLEPLAQSLTATAAAIIAISPSETRGLNVIHGVWNIPAVSLQELARLASSLAQDLKAYGIDDVDESGATVSLPDLLQRVESLRAQTVPQIWGGNGTSAIPAFVIGMQELRKTLAPLMPRNDTVDPKAMPAHSARRIKRLNDEVNAIVVDRDALKLRMNEINEAYEAAESLPEDLASLREARDEIARISKQVSKDALETDGLKQTSTRDLSAIQALGERAAKLVDQCEEAYRVTTSKGLAGAFELRAQGLTRSMQLWVAALVLALGIAAFLGYHRVELLSASLAAVEPKWGAICLNFVLSLLSVGAPLWFAWVATKQIGQRFKLSEDYAYKASISKAYEGYRREAADLDPAFIARLFGSSLSRLEEAPMRLLEPTAHGSPLHELFAARRRKGDGGRATPVRPEHDTPEAPTAE